MKKAMLVLLFGFFGITLFAQTQFEAKFKDLPKETQKYITKNYEGWTIDKCLMSENEKGKMTTCEVYASKGTEKVKLIFDKDGGFVKKEIVTELPKAPAPAAAVPPPPPPPPAAADTTKKKK